MKEDNISQLGNDDVPFCEQQYTHGSSYISLFKLKSFDQLIPPKLPQILDITQLWHYSIHGSIFTNLLRYRFHKELQPFSYLKEK